MGGGSSSALESSGETWRQTMGAICSRRASEDRGLPDAKGMRELQQQQHNSSPVQQPAPCPSPSGTNGTITAAAAAADTTVAPKVFVMVATHEIEDLEERKKTPELADAKPESGAVLKTEFSYVNEDFSFEAATAAAAAGASSVDDDDDANGGHGTTVNNNTNTEEQQRVRLSRMLSARANAVRSKTTNAAKKGAFRVHTSSIIIFLPMGLDHCKKLPKMLFCCCRGMGGA